MSVGGFPVGDFVFEEAETLFEHGAIAGVAGDLEVVEDAGALEMEIFELTLLFELGWSLWGLLREALALVLQVLGVVGIFGCPASCHFFLVPRDRVVNFHRPTLDAAGKADCIFETLTTEPDDSVETSDAVVTIDDELFAFCQTFDAIEVCRDGVHGDQLRGHNAGELVFVIFAAIQE